MAQLTIEQKAFIVQALACFDTPSKVAEAVKEEFGIIITRQQVEQSDPTKACSRGLAKKWVEMFWEVRNRFQTEISDIPIANKSYRLRALDRMASKAETSKNMALAAQLIEQAAKEAGGMYSNKHIIDHSSTDGSMSPKPAIELTDSQLAEIIANGNKG